MGHAPRGLAAAGVVAAFCAVAVPPAHADTDFGLRYWYGFGQTAKNLFGFTDTDMVSRLTYTGLKTSSAEIFGRIGQGGVFLKGFAGFGKIGDGNLQDEDFPPVITPYSSTDSDQRSGKLSYGTLDAGYYFGGTDNSRIGAFVGYNFLIQTVNAYGCEQTGGNPGVCVPTIDGSVLGITQHNAWYSGLIGVSGDVKLGRLQIGGDAAVAYSHLQGSDHHWLRPDFSGPIPEDGWGWGYQLEATADYQLTPKWSIGGGVRYWHMTSQGDAHFGGISSGGGDQHEEWYTTMWGFTAHVSMRF